jgi:hypothetical protein
MTYNQSDLITDIQVCARTMHLSYRRAKFILERWFSGLNTEIANDATEYTTGITGIEINNIITRCSEIVADYETGSNSKLNTILQLSDLSLPTIE